MSTSASASGSAWLGLVAPLFSGPPPGMLVFLAFLELLAFVGEEEELSAVDGLVEPAGGCSLSFCLFFGGRPMTLCFSKTHGCPLFEHALHTCSSFSEGMHRILRFLWVCEMRNDGIVF